MYYVWKISKGNLQYVSFLAIPMAMVGVEFSVGHDNPWEYLFHNATRQLPATHS
jgi:hypothetical protein